MSDVVQLTDASGNVVKNYHYDAFGVEESYITLAHELIHDDSAMNANETVDEYLSYRSEKYEYEVAIGKEEVKIGSITLPWKKTIYEKDYATKEELATVGIKYAQWGSITQNSIKKEHGLYRRIVY